MTDDRALEKKGLQRFARDVLYDSIVSITSRALLAAAVALLGAMIALVVTGWKVPAWSLILAALVAVALMYVTRRVAGREADELRPKVDKAEDELDRHESYGSNICSALDIFQKIVAKDIKMSMASFIEQGVLIPGRDVMLENGRPRDLRMSVLIPAGGHFQMIWASGHSVEAKQKFRVPIDQTIAKVAYEKQAIQVWKNAPKEERGFVKNPKATRGFRSMVAIPILRGASTAGVFNVVTDQESAFDPADVNYLTSLGSIIQLAFGMAIEEVQAKSVEDDAQAGLMSGERREVAEAASSRRPVPLPSVLAQDGAGSSAAADKKEASDE